MRILRFLRNLTGTATGDLEQPQNDYAFGDIAKDDWAPVPSGAVTAPSGEDWAD